MPRRIFASDLRGQRHILCLRFPNRENSAVDSPSATFAAGARRRAFIYNRYNRQLEQASARETPSRVSFPRKADPIEISSTRLNLLEKK